MTEPETQTFSITPVPPPPTAERGLFLPLAIILAGMLWLSAVAVFELRWLESQPWTDALILPENHFDGDEARPVSVRRVHRPPEETSPQLNALEAWLSEVDLNLRLSDAERLVSAPVSDEELGMLLASGRIPRRGMPEVLAGDLASDTPFILDGVAFTVTGRLHQGTSAFLYAYLLPSDAAHDALFFDAGETLFGWLHPEGLRYLRAMATENRFDAVMDEEEPKERLQPMGGQVRTLPSMVWAAFYGLIVIAFGGALLHGRLYARLCQPPTKVFGPLLQETTRRKGLFWGIHLALYSVFFAAMATGARMPLLNYRMTEYISSLFLEGELEYIGSAYASGDILQAALATLYNNYVVQTLGLTFLLSVPPLALGVLKNALSFGLVGFGMTPLWAGSASGYVYHSITMVLELEAYILACFVVVVWAIRIFRAMSSPGAATEFRTNLHIFTGGVILTGVMLFLAALYEAATLILFAGF